MNTSGNKTSELDKNLAGISTFYPAFPPPEPKPYVVKGFLSSQDQFIILTYHSAWVTGLYNKEITNEGN